MELTWGLLRRLLVDGTDFIMPPRSDWADDLWRAAPSHPDGKRDVEIWKAIHPDHTA